jgi:hypothetical protein
MNPRLHVAMHEIVANQLWNGDPPEVWETAERLQGLGYERHEILHMLAGVAGENIWQMLAEKRQVAGGRWFPRGSCSAGGGKGTQPAKGASEQIRPGPGALQA